MVSGYRNSISLLLSISYMKSTGRGYELLTKTEEFEQIGLLSTRFSWIFGGYFCFINSCALFGQGFESFILQYNHALSFSFLPPH